MIMLCSSNVDLKANMAGLELAKRDIVVFPLNDNMFHDDQGGYHWGLLVLHRPRASFLFYDSLGQKNFRQAHLTARKIARVFPEYEEYEFMTEPTPQQINLWDCGLYVCAITSQLAQLYLQTCHTPLSPDTAREQAFHFDITPGFITTLRQEMRQGLWQMFEWAGSNNHNKIDSVAVIQAASEMKEENSVSAASSLSPSSDPIDTSAAAADSSVAATAEWSGSNHNNKIDSSEMKAENTLSVNAEPAVHCPALSPTSDAMDTCSTAADSSVASTTAAAVSAPSAVAAVAAVAAPVDSSTDSS
eukprot:TRINITY_DN6604_c0_g1_i3.p1 TRINITY_DN6604_c0_g1~~TRINITY_DN6604_c0_g1_i3.p1  ORF type:complete len:302 (-),score=73.81 TRINITY_DN6604_c0_g1_i3:138-1043(-)